MSATFAISSGDAVVAFFAILVSLNLMDKAHAAPRCKALQSGVAALSRACGEGMEGLPDAWRSRWGTKVKRNGNYRHGARTNDAANATPVPRRVVVERWRRFLVASRQSRRHVYRPAHSPHTGTEVGTDTSPTTRLTKRTCSAPLTWTVSRGGSDVCRGW